MRVEEKERRRGGGKEGEREKEEERERMRERERKREAELMKRSKVVSTFKSESPSASEQIYSKYVLSEWYSKLKYQWFN